MSHDRRDLPVRPLDDRDLPVPVGGEAPIHEMATPGEPGWTSFASQRVVHSVALDRRRGELWLATSGGVLRWRRQLGRYTRYASEHGLPGSAARAIAVDGGGRVWVAPEKRGLYLLDGDQWRAYPDPDVATTRVNAMSVDGMGRLWLAQEKVIYAIERADDPPALRLAAPGNLPRALIARGDGEIVVWDARGIYRRQGSGWSSTAFPGVLALAFDADSLWVGTLDGLSLVDLAGGAVYRCARWPTGESTTLAPGSGGVWAAVAGFVGLANRDGWTPRGACQPGVRVSAAIDAGNGEVWIGTDAGLQRGGPAGRVLHLTDAPPDVIGMAPPHQPPPSFDNLVQALALQRHGDHDVVWIGTAQGLFWLHPFGEHWRGYTQSVLRDVRSLATRGAHVLAATWSGGVYQIAYDAPPERIHSLPDDVVALAAGPGMPTWAAALGGVYRCDGETWNLVIPAGQLPVRARVRALAQVDHERLWIATSSGLLVYHVAGDTLESADPDILGTDVRALLPCPDGARLWIGTNRGLYQGELGAFTSIAESAGYTINAFVWDAESTTLWAGTDAGLLRLPASAAGVAQLLTPSDSGLAAERVTALAIGRGETGETCLWIGTTCGLNRYCY